MTVAATGLLTLPLSNVRNLLANCPTFQTLMQVNTVAKAKARIFYVETDEEFVAFQDRDQYPNRCIVDYEPNAFGSERQGTTNWTTIGPIEARIEVETLAEYRDDIQDATLWFLDAIGGIISEARDLATSGTGYLNVINISLGMHGRIDPAEYNSVRGFGADLVFGWRGL